MAEFPALPLWTDAYLADTRHLSTMQHGAYLLLLMEAWRRPNTDLPDDDTLLARLAGMSAEEWTREKPVVMSFWRLDGRTKTWQQKRLNDEKSYVTKKGKQQRSNAKSRWAKEKGASRGNANPDANAMPEASQTDAPTPTPTPTPITPPKGGVGDPQPQRNFEGWERTLLGLDDIRFTNLGVSPMGPMVQLQIDGFDLISEVLPVVEADLARAKTQGRLNKLAWSTIAKKVREARLPGSEAGTGPAPAQPSQSWEKRMEFARRKQAWDSAKWGPYPNQPGCLVPANLVKPSDGKGWIEWKDMVA